jgi:hypothetical protein
MTTVTPPPQAVTAGYTTPVLIDDFTSNTISPNGQGIYNWYPVDGLTNYSESNGTLTIGSDTSGFGAGLSTVPNNGNDPNAALSTPGKIAVNTGNGVVYQYGYFQATLSFNPGGYTGSGDWPAFWMGHDAGGPQNPSSHFDEIDILEGMPGWPPKTGVPAEDTATLHEWAPGYVAASPQHAFNTSQNINFNQPNTFGCLWTPTSISIYLNNVLQSTVAIGPGTPYPSASIDFNSLILGTGYNWPVKFTSVDVWQSGTIPGSTPTPTPTPTPIPTPTPTVTPSANDTVVKAGSSSAITDAAGNKWTITSGGQISVNGVVDAVTAGVIELAYVDGKIWQENSNLDWWGKTSPTASWSPTAGTTVSPLPASIPTPAPTPASPNGTTITTASGSPIVDKAGNAWSLVQSASSGLQIAVNGTVDSTTGHVVLLETLNGNIEQENTRGSWYEKSTPSASWTQIAAPTVNVTAAPTNVTTAVSAAKVGTTSADGGTFVMTAPGVAEVTLGTTADTLKFVGLSSVSLTGGHAASTITVDGGTNTFTGGAGAMTIPGGVGADAYVYHANDGLMTVKDFSLAKGDTLTVDKGLQASMTETSDGHGGVIVGFGTMSHGVDLAGVTSVTSSQIHFA